MISDFDMTLSRFKDNEGHLCDSSYGNFSVFSASLHDIKLLSFVHGNIAASVASGILGWNCLLN